MSEKIMEQPGVWWQDVLKWIENNWFQMGIIGLIAKLIDKVFKFMSDSRDSRFREIVKEENKILEEKIEAKLEHYFKFSRK